MTLQPPKRPRGRPRLEAAKKAIEVSVSFTERDLFGVTRMARTLRMSHQEVIRRAVAAAIRLHEGRAARSSQRVVMRARLGL